MKKFLTIKCNILNKIKEIKDIMVTAVTTIWGKYMPHLNNVIKSIVIMSVRVALYGKGKITDLFFETNIKIIDTHTGKTPFDHTTTLLVKIWRTFIIMKMLTYNPNLKIKRN